MKRATSLSLVLILILSAALSWGAQDFRAQLSGNEEVPKVKTPATGVLDLTYAKNRLEYVLKVNGITSPTAATLHLGRKGEDGPPVAGLYGGAPIIGPFNGVLAQGSITADSLIGDLQGKKLSDLVRLIKSGKIYVNILTETYPAGEIRGQLTGR